MKLFDALAKKQLPVLHTQKRDAEKLFARGVKHHMAFDGAIKSARREAIEAGFDFLQAKAGFEHGDWMKQCAVYEKEISDRTIRSYMQLADLSWRWVLYKNPKVKDIDEIKKLAIEMVLVSPKPLVELCRELGHVLKFGGYFEEDYQEKKKKNLLGGQIEFDFTAAESTLRMICDPKVALKFPDGADEVEKLTELQGTLKSASLRISHRLKELQAIDA